MSATNDRNGWTSFIRRIYEFRAADSFSVLLSGTEMKANMLNY